MTQKWFEEASSQTHGLIIKYTANCLIRQGKNIFSVSVDEVLTMLYFFIFPNNKLFRYGGCDDYSSILQIHSVQQTFNKSNYVPGMLGREKKTWSPSSKNLHFNTEWAMELNDDNIMCDIWYTEQLGYTEEQHLSLEIESGSASKRKWHLGWKMKNKLKFLMWKGSWQYTQEEARVYTKATRRYID